MTALGVRLSEITTGLTSTNHSVTSHFHFRFVSSCYSDACVANAAVIEKSLNLLLHVQLGSDTNDQSRCESLVNQEKHITQINVERYSGTLFSAPLTDVALAVRA